MTADWIPVSLVNVDQRHLLRWIHPGSGPLFREPFFKQSVEALLAEGAPQRLTPLDALSEVAPIKAPKGFIFHVSRCGSTLISRSLAALPRHRVISEPPPLNHLLLAEDIDPPLKAELLEGMIHALCGSADGVDCFFKFTSWNVLFLEEIRALFPDTPWLFVYREPIDVVLSSTKGPPRWSENEPLARRMGNPHMGGVEHILFNLERMYEAPLGKLDGLGRLVEYAQLPAAMAGIGSHFGLTLSQDEWAQVARVGQFEAKGAGEVVFRPRVRAPISDAMDAAMAPLRELYGRLESVRTAPPALSLAPPRHAHDLRGDRQMHWLARLDQRLVALMEAGRVPLPDDDALVHMYRRRGDLAAARAEVDRLSAAGVRTPALARLHATLHEQSVPPCVAATELAPAPFVHVDAFLQAADRQGRDQNATSVDDLLGSLAEPLRRLAREHQQAVCARLGVAMFDVDFIRLRVVEQGDGDHFLAHQDSCETHPPSRVTFVYRYHRQPRPYTGGDLLLYDTRLESLGYARSNFTRIILRNDTLTFFPSEHFHEILPVIASEPGSQARHFTVIGHMG